MKRTIRVGCGAGFQGDRLDPALVLAERGELDYLGLGCLGERTVALAQLRRRKDPSSGYDPLLERRMTRLLPLVKKHSITLITNMGAYLDTVLSDQAGGFYGSQDADEAYYGLDAAGRAGIEPPYVDRRVYTSWTALLARGYLA